MPHYARIKSILESSWRVSYQFYLMSWYVYHRRRAFYANKEIDFWERNALRNDFIVNFIFQSGFTFLWSFARIYMNKQTLGTIDKSVWAFLIKFPQDDLFIEVKALPHFILLFVSDSEWTWSRYFAISWFLWKNIMQNLML